MSCFKTICVSNMQCFKTKRVNSSSSNVLFLNNQCFQGPTVCRCGGPKHLKGNLTKKTLKSRTIIQFWSKDLIFKPTSIAKTLKHKHSLKEVSSRTCNNVQNMEKKILITIQYYYMQLSFIIIILFGYY